jgi:hypothetical protein
MAIGDQQRVCLADRHSLCTGLTYPSTFSSLVGSFTSALERTSAAQARVSDLGRKTMTRLIRKPVFISKVSKTKKKKIVNNDPFKNIL